MESIRDICVRIDSKLTLLATGGERTAAPKPRPTHARKTVARLSDVGMEALELALSDIAKPFTMGQLVDAMIDITPGCCTKGGEYYESVRAGICELQGLAIRYNSTRN